MIPFVVTPAAEEDIQQIDNQLVLESPDAAERVSRAIEDAMTTLAERPMLGHTRADLTSRPFRFWSVYSYLVIYRADTVPIQIIRIIHGSRDVAQQLLP